MFSLFEMLRSVVETGEGEKIAIYSFALVPGLWLGTSLIENRGYRPPAKNCDNTNGGMQTVVAGFVRMQNTLISYESSYQSLEFQWKAA